MLTAQEKMSELDDIADKVAKEIENSRFEHFHSGRKNCWFHPPKEKVIDKTLVEEVYLLKEIGKKAGLSLMHPDVHAMLAACYSEDTTFSRDENWNFYSVNNGFIVQRTNKGVDIRKVLDAKFIDKEFRKPSKIVIIDSKGENVMKSRNFSKETALQAQYIVGPTLQTEIPTRSGYFGAFRGVIPVDAELNDGDVPIYRRGRWWETDDGNFVRTQWEPKGDYPYVGIGHMCKGNMLPIYTEMDPNK
jgi:hypothetical protein